MNAAAQLQKAIVRENSGDLAGAMAEYQKVVRREPGNIDALFLLGRGHCQLGELETGGHAFRKIIKLRPGHAPAHTLLGMVLFRLGKLQDALDSLERALAADPNFELALANKADVLTELGQHAAAVGEYDRALAINAGNLAAWCNRGNALQVLGRYAEAVENFRQALTRSPQLPEAHFNMANALHKLKRNEEAVAHYRHALALRPGLADIYLNLGAALVGLRRWNEAADVYRQAVKLKPDSAPAHYGLGLALLELERHDESLINLDRALALDPGFSRAIQQKARLLMNLGRLDDARALLSSGIEKNPRDFGSYALLARLRQFTFDDPLIAAMEGLLQDAPTLDAEGQINVHFALANAFADCGQYDRSFRHMVQANALKRQQIEYDEHAVLDTLRQIQRIITSDLLETNAGNGNPSDRPIFIVGMPRSGSTLIEQILASHPQVHGGGELQDFPKALASLKIDASVEYPDLVEHMASAQFDELGSTYLARIAERAPVTTRLTDKYLANCHFVGLIRLALPNARIIHARRNPIDTCVSCFSILFADEQPFAYDLGELGRYYRAYDRLMQHWHDVLPEGAMLEVQYEDVVADLETQVRRIIAYCGLDWDDACLAFHKTARPVATASAMQVRQPIYRTSVERWRRYGDQLKPLLEALGETG